MNLERIQELAFKIMGKRKSHLNREKGFIYYHGQRVANLSLNLRKRLFPDDSSKDDIMFAGALFHDVTKGIEPHNITGAQVIKSLIPHECTDAQLEEISEIILLHNARNREKLPPPIRVVQDADVLDHFGSLEIWLKFMYSAHNEESVHDAIRLWESKEHKQYLQESRDSLNYNLSKAIFDRKMSFHLAFQQRFRMELNGQFDG
ncbi:HD domain-containing protein [Paenibacillus harenae]|uniref:HD domain-containing protein n=1 Tax=Paenibacillus harenae TaxID=306543 RepID=UPI000429BC49|nr:HD domain-containing protein [Paenibacillus harenae]